MAVLIGLHPAMAADAIGIDHDVDAALRKLYDTMPAARSLAGKAKGILVFPNIVKVGFVVGAQFGDGTLRKYGKTVGYNNIAAASYGLQAGVQSFAYAMFFLTDSALAYLKKSAGFEVGCGSKRRGGGRKTLTTTTEG